MKKIALIALTVIGLVGCQTTVIPSHNTPAIVKKPTEKLLCTMEYDPVCGKVENNGIFSYKTYGNACSASNSDDKVVSFTGGACGAGK